ncbi:peptidoglycan/xylan/chitin deacetylase (PgdA/CDA1 family) [Kitasatospora sp. MAP12-15]|uniref:polysaccharide deacetylase family protein n=1 Tax=unclassified Kitasatospora TaxID=2633591 RepID=UPI0024742D5B|nr:polysaccharide deacetylase family protein [Kitasatospora sp. MAP12-44]MDH6110957.1 peptidoglycan/xylan/chitin deacetylase (PgdA/CDA1 family) [Kitasatospora sp. MAP12-44]
MRTYDWGRARTYLAGSLVVAAAISGCGSSAGPHNAQGGPPAAGQPALPPPATTLPTGAPSGAVDPAAWAKWKLQPLPAAPPAPAVKPVKLTKTGTVPVISSIPTTDKVVFVTIDDGAEKDPKFIEMMNDLKVPITMFLMNDTIKDNYGYFKPLQALGNSIQNHTLHHPAMSTKSAAEQKAEVCGDQQVITQQYGTAPFLFRPPYGDGAHTPTLNTAVQQCGPRAVVIWQETMQIHDMQYQTADKKLKPGDIILAHFRGPSELKGETMTEMFGELLSRIQEQGFAVARLDDYIQPPS